MKRKPLPFWDRIKFLLLFAVLFAFLTMAALDNPLLSVEDALRKTRDEKWWLIALAGVEVLRQIHFLISEHWAGYNQFWTERVFGGTDRWLRRRFSDWTRYRLARAVKWIFWITLSSLVLAAIWNTTPALALARVPGWVWSHIPFAFQIIFLFFFVAIQFLGMFWLLTRGGVDVLMPDDVKTRFSDVWGQDHVLERVKENMVFLENPEAIEKRGGYVPGGVLLWGPPGTGKTLMAEAVAGETGKPYVFVDPGAFTNMFMGIGILRVKLLFRKLRKLALRYGGVITFFDEADALGNRGTGIGTVGRGGFSPLSAADGPFTSCHGFAYLPPPVQASLFPTFLASGGELPGSRHGFFMGGMGGGGGGMGTLQALLTELSGLNKPRGLINRHVRRALGMRPKPPPKYRIMVMMATNMVGALDEALLRPGRIDRIYHVGYPSKEGRKRTYEGYLSKVQHDLSDEQVDRLATITPFATGASIKDLVNEALIVAMRDDRDVITFNDVLRAKLLKSVGPPEGVDYVARERHAVAVHEACHAVVGYRVMRRLVIDTATIQKNEGTLGFVQSIPVEERFGEWRSEYEASIMSSLASLVGERMFFGGDNSNGVGGDLRSATHVALMMEGVYGMGSTIGSHAAVLFQAQGMAVIDGTDRKVLESELGRRAEKLMAGLAERTKVILEEERRHVLAVAHVLETHRTVSGDDVIAVIEGTEGPLVDGRAYALQENIDLLERYHATALEVHQGREWTMPLPVIALPPDDEPEDAVANLTGTETTRAMLVTAAGDGHPNGGPELGDGFTRLADESIAGPDVDAAARFYREEFDSELVRDGTPRVAYAVLDIDAACRTLRDRGLRLLYDQPREGSAGSRVNFIHPNDSDGALVELVEPADPSSNGSER
ncbi:MAG TPA: AAA family ATPase [Actinomycetes bacterium]|nr:AAA family ATPase [Actinomycetes bacterium]